MRARVIPRGNSVHEGEEGGLIFATKPGPRDSFIWALGREGAVAKAEGAES